MVNNEKWNPTVDEKYKMSIDLLKTLRSNYTKGSREYSSYTDGIMVLARARKEARNHQK